MVSNRLESYLFYYFLKESLNFSVTFDWTDLCFFFFVRTLTLELDHIQFNIIYQSTITYVLFYLTHTCGQNNYLSCTIRMCCRILQNLDCDVQYLHTYYSMQQVSKVIHRLKPWRCVSECVCLKKRYIRDPWI